MVAGDKECGGGNCLEKLLIPAIMHEILTNFLLVARKREIRISRGQIESKEFLCALQISASERPACVLACNTCCIFYTT